MPPSNGHVETPSGRTAGPPSSSCASQDASTGPMSSSMGPASGLKPDGHGSQSFSATSTGPKRPRAGSASSGANDKLGQGGGGDDVDVEGGWQTIHNGRPAKRRKKAPKPGSGNYPTIAFSPNARLQSKIQVSDLRGLVLYILADGPAPQWIAVTHRPAFRKMVVIMVPGLEEAMFKADVDLGLYETNQHKPKSRVHTSPDDYYPRSLEEDRVPEALRPLARIFSQLWPVRATADERGHTPRLHSPIITMLRVPLPKSKGGGLRPMSDSQGWRDVRTRITEFVATPQQYFENNFVLHPAMLPDVESRRAFRDREGWVYTRVERLEDAAVPEADIEQGSVTAGREVFAVDCEMCRTGPTNQDLSLTRVTVITWDGKTVMDELVKPELPILDYLTPFSGITREMLESVTTTLHDIQQRLLALLHPRAILVGHSLDSDLKALKLAHPFVVDTSIIFPNPSAPSGKHSLKHLAARFLGREVQAHEGSAKGHDSHEDAMAALDLVKKKCEKGRDWGSAGDNKESLFRRLARSGTSYRAQGGPAATGGVASGKTTAAVDWEGPSLTQCGDASVVIPCKSDADVEAGIMRAVAGDADGRKVKGGGVDFVWARMRELEALRGWWNRSRLASGDAGGPPTVEQLQRLIREDDATNLDARQAETGAGQKRHSLLEAAVAGLAHRIARIHAALPPCTALIVFSGTGNPLEVERLRAQQARYKQEYNTPGSNWNRLSVKWTELEDQTLRRAVKDAREGVGFVTVK